MAARRPGKRGRPGSIPGRTSARNSTRTPCSRHRTLAPRRGRAHQLRQRRPADRLDQVAVEPCLARQTPLVLAPVTQGQRVSNSLKSQDFREEVRV